MEGASSLERSVSWGEGEPRPSFESSSWYACMDRTWPEIRRSHVPGGKNSFDATLGGSSKNWNRPSAAGAVTFQENWKHVSSIFTVSASGSALQVRLSPERERLPPAGRLVRCVGP